MKYLRKFNEALSNSELEQIEETFFDYFPADFDGCLTINPEDGAIDITENKAVIINKMNHLERLPIKFGSVPYQFLILNCPFTTLEGCPHTTQYFKAEKTNITDLTGSPIKVVRYVLSDNSKLSSLKGLGHLVDQLEVFDCPITSLEGCPSIIGGEFMIDGTEIKNLIGGPSEVGSEFYIGGASITSLEGMPNKVTFLHLECPNVWDPSPLRNLEVKGEMTIEGPISSLVAFFYTIDGWGNLYDQEFLIMGSWNRFKDSLDYNYVRQRGEEWVIIHFRFLEALAEIDMTPDNFSEDLQEMDSIGPYKFVDEEGDYVNLLGEKLPQG